MQIRINGKGKEKRCPGYCFLAIMFNKIPINAEVDARFSMILENYPCFWVRTGHASFHTNKEQVKLFWELHRERSKFKTHNYQMQINLWQTVCLPLKSFTYRILKASRCDLLKLNFLIDWPVSEATIAREAPNFFSNSANLIGRTKSTGFKYLKLYKDYAQENEFRSFEVYCMTLSTHFVKKKAHKHALYVT